MRYQQTRYNAPRNRAGLIRRSPTQNICEKQRGTDRCVALDHEFVGFGKQFVPRDFFIGRRAAVSAVACHGIADLTEVRPERY